MERATFIEALENRASLTDQSQKEWSVLSAEYPYASLVQLLAYQKKGKVSSAAQKRLLLHFDNPLHLAVATSNYAMETVEVDSSKETIEEVKPISKKKKIRVAPISKSFKQSVKDEQPIKVEKLVEEKQALQETAPKEEVIKAAVVEPVTEVPIEIPKKETVEEKQLKEAKGKEDVLELINELPEERPIKKTEPIPAKEDIEEETTAKDPGDLMVMMSFTDWLNHFKSKSENEAEEKKGKDAIRSAWQKEKLAEAMDDEEDVVPDDIFEKAMKSVSFGDGLVTEPLAELYVKQGKTDKAIELYKKLSLLNPEKRAYFASRIKDLHLLK